MTTMKPVLVCRTFAAGLLIIFSISISSTNASGRCFRCNHNHISTDNNAIVKTLLGWISDSVGVPECKLDGTVEAILSQTKALDVVQCPDAADPDSIYMCTTVKGRITTSIAGVDVHWDTWMRDCLQVPKYDPQYNEGCTEGETVSAPVKYALQQASKGASSLNLENDLRFRGKTCFNKSSNLIPDPKQSLQCVTCTRAELTSGTGLVDTVLGIFSTLTKNDECLMENYDDRYRVASRICPDPSSGNRAVCGVISGESSIAGVDVTYKTTERGCIEQPDSQFIPIGGCTTELPREGSMKTLLKQGLSEVVKNLGSDINFKGLVCYSNDGLGKPTLELGLVGEASQNTVASTVSLLVLTGMSLIFCLLL